MADTPRITIGVPVFNGERYLEEAIQSVVDSTFTDWELIVSDNASTDRTEEIARAFAERDPRIRYERNATNIGALPNFNRLVGLARGEFFKWLAYDDLCDPELFGRCVDVLDRDASVVLCNGRYREIDPAGERLKDQPYRIDLTSAQPHRRLGALMGTDAGHMILYGLIRTSTLRETHLLAPYHGSDRALLAELTLFGRLYEIPELLWSSREHPDRSIYVRTTMAGWEQPGHRLPTHLAIALNMANIIASAPLPRVERLRCGMVLLGSVAKRAPQLVPVIVAEIRDAVRGLVRRPSA
jgi:glycosyltransferase involved in cell wall biosynthesis